MKKRILLIAIFITVQAIAQNPRKYLFGKIFDKVGALPNVHIINSKTLKATYANDQGEFKIQAQAGDSLRFSYVGYETKFVVLNKKHFSIGDNIFDIDKTTYTLDEIELRRNDLLGSLSADVRETPKDRKDEALRRTMDFSDVDMTIVEPDDHIDERVRPEVVNTDPTRQFVGAGGSVNMPFGYSERLWRLRRELAFKKGMPAKMMNEFGEKFFFEELRIPPEKYYHFLEYCNPLGIENLYKKGKKMEVIKILQHESKSYQQVLKKLKNE